MMKYLEGEELTIDGRSRLQSAQGLYRQRDRSGHSAAPLTSNKGVQPLLDAVIDYMPAPTDIPAIKGVNPRDRRGGLPSVFRRGAVLCTGVQDRYRPVSLAV